MGDLIPIDYESVRRRLSGRLDRLLRDRARLLAERHEAEIRGEPSGLTLAEEAIRDLTADIASTKNTLAAWMRRAATG